MVLIQISLTKEQDAKAGIHKIKKGFNTKEEAIQDIIERFREDREWKTKQ